MPRLAAVMLAALAVTLACGGGDDDGDATTSVTGAGTLATPTATLESSNEKPTPAPTPAPGEFSVANEAFSVEAADGVVLKGHLYSPDGPKRQALIIVAPVDQSIWAESTRAFTSEGIAVFTFDARGFGETGGDEDPDALADDARLITRFVMSREYPLVYLFGVGREANNAVLETAPSLDGLTGLITYGAETDIHVLGELPQERLQLSPDQVWAGENVFDKESVRDAVLEFVLGN